MAAPDGLLALASIRVEGWGPAFLIERSNSKLSVVCLFVCWVGRLCQMINEESDTSSRKERGFRSDRD